MSEKKCYITVNCEDDTPKIGEDADPAGPQDQKGDTDPNVELELRFANIERELANCYKLSGGTAIPINADLFTDTYKVPGNYYCNLNLIAQTLKHCPTKNAFTLKVALSTGTAYPSLTLKDFYTGKVFYAFYDQDSNRWVNWS